MTEELRDIETWTEGFDQHIVRAKAEHLGEDDHVFVSLEVAAELEHVKSLQTQVDLVDHHFGKLGRRVGQRGRFADGEKVGKLSSRNQQRQVQCDGVRDIGMSHFDRHFCSIQ